MKRSAVGRRQGLLEPAHSAYGDWWNGLAGPDGDVAWGWQPFGTTSDGRRVQHGLVRRRGTAPCPSSTSTKTPSATETT